MNAGPQLGDFTTSRRVIPISLMAIGIGVVSAFVALILVRLIGVFTNLLFFHRWGTAIVPITQSDGLLTLIVPMLGGLVIGLMARFGSERIRGHGIPEAIEAILISQSRVEPRVAFLKPLSSAISIGSGGPFGAEGPIIMTGGAIGSVIGQFLRLTGAERRTLLVAGAAGGMAATFASPIAATLLAVELLLFEWKPRSLIPVGLASATATVVRFYLLGGGPLFPVPPHAANIGPVGMLGAVIVGLAAGAGAALLTAAVYAAEDAFHHLPIHWMWWPALGGLAIGIGGLFFPQALGVGYGTIADLVSGQATMHIILGVLLVKSAIWAISLGSGTSGGVLAPLLMMGAALGALFGHVLPNEGAGFWSLICMGAILGGTMRSPFTGIIFTIELTHDLNALLPLLVAVLIAHGFTVVLMKRSILTEKVARRGYHLAREYSVDPLEITRVREVMATDVTSIPTGVSPADLRSLPGLTERRQRLYPVIDDDARVVGAVTRGELAAMNSAALDEPSAAAVLNRPVVTAHPDEPLRVVAYRMAETNLTVFPVVGDDDRLLGLISLTDLLHARKRGLDEENRRERILGVRRVRLGQQQV